VFTQSRKSVKPVDKSVEKSISETTKNVRGEHSHCGYFKEKKIWSGKRPDAQSLTAAWWLV
jgi:hypothetical protein